jgi:copper homeostasis protein (lipoprotein)
MRLSRLLLLVAQPLAACALVAALSACAKPPTSAPATADAPPARVGGMPVSRFHGTYARQGDAATFVDCANGLRLPVAEEGDWRALRRAYEGAGVAPGTAVLATLDGYIERRPKQREETVSQLFVARVVALDPQRGCDGPSSAGATLETTYWKLVRLRGKPVVASRAQQSEPHLILHPGSERRVAGSGGCNRLSGGYSLDGDRLTFSRVAATRMACPDGMDQEGEFLETLASVGRWRIAGGRLELISPSGPQPAATFEAGKQP